jgi:diguanylate cyclase (GGDEF)-like protein
MNLVDRHDSALIIGLAVAVMIVFAQPIRRLVDVARDVERSSGLALIPALIILTVVFVFNQQAKRREAKAQAEAAEAEAIRARAHAVDMERLAMFGQALGRSLDLDTIREVVIQHMPQLAGNEDAWVMTRVSGSWQVLMGAARDPRPEARWERERVADQALAAEDQPAFAMDGHRCLLLTAGGHPVGVLGLPESDEIDTKRQRILAAAAALLGISIRNAELFRDVRENSLRDGLTGCFNRTHAMELVAIELMRAKRAQKPVSLIMFDIDHFKQVNDRFGHLCGDAVLAAIGTRMREMLRASDLKCRFGGEEFLVLLPETPEEGARRVAETLRRELAEMPIEWKERALRITASFGVAVALPTELDAQAFVARADQALYIAKDEGRNCVRLVTEPVRVPQVMRQAAR